MITRITCIFLFLIVNPLLGQADVANIGVLPGAISETSGLIFFNDKLITHNDSGNSAFLYELDTVNFNISRTVTVVNADNADWEDLTQDEDYIYIGDFGNNLGGREDLAIYRIAKSDYIASDTVMADRIDFSYEDQIDFDGNELSDWDAEAFIALENEFIIFTKQWQSNGTNAYSLPKTPGTYQAVNVGGYISDGLITGATYNVLSGVLFLVGYSQQLQPFLIRQDELTDEFSFSSTAEKIPLSVGFAQIESIAYSDENTYYLTSERFTNDNPPITLDAGIFSFNTNDDVIGEENPEEPPPVDPPVNGEDGEELIIFIAPNSKELQYSLNVDVELFGRAIFDVTGRRIHHTHANDIVSNTIDLSIFRSAVYYLTFYLQGRTIAKPFILK
ncbi:T9SS C-terminal target domain-containing protein [Muriicola sp. Z0-33]|uniref:T9SS C-terminal target domain-containing protein n=1 Tax=Muriicola sp. Z0-33 TaxID=2816957 RepID=UPI002238F888|nr:T9SS C-terminal target domain-containing protein [Muriicola sp. Z0-33]MCW5515522.1 T9SS C-terminal target domain-containing protein [Muriicola sp. Z0-33]